jgi:cytochrome c556
MVLAAALLSVTTLTVGISAADDEDSPLHKLMEQVNAKNNAITKGVRTPVAYKKAQETVVKSAEEIVKLSKQAKGLGKDYIKKAKDVPNAAGKWDELMDHFTAKAEELVKVAEKSDSKQEEAKAAHNTLKKSCADCHTIFRVEE